jgi:hypothetical protein
LNGALSFYPSLTTGKISASASEKISCGLTTSEAMEVSRYSVAAFFFPMVF